MNRTAPKPLLVVCPTCNAQEFEPCTTPTDRGRRNVPWFHLTREDRAALRAVPQ